MKSFSNFSRRRSFQNFSIIFLLASSITLLLISCFRDDINPTLNDDNRILTRTDYGLYTESQLSEYANMDFIDTFVMAYSYALDNLTYDTARISLQGTESALLYRINQFQESLSLNEYEELPGFFYLRDITEVPGITATEIDIFTDADQIIVDHYNDINGFYDEFKNYIENIDIESLNSNIQEKVATSLYLLDIFYHFSDDVQALGWGNCCSWRPTINQIRCAGVVGGSTALGSLTGSPVVGILSGMVAWFATDPCWE